MNTRTPYHRSTQEESLRIYGEAHLDRTIGVAYRRQVRRSLDALTSTLEGDTSPLLTSTDTWIIRALPKLGNPQRPPPLSPGGEVAWVIQKGINRGMADVYLDGVKVSTVDLYSDPGQPRKVVFAKKDLDPTVEHTLEVRALGTKNSASSGKRVDLDAFVVLR